MMSFFGNWIKINKLVGRTIYLEGNADACWGPSGREIDIKKVTSKYVYFGVCDTRCNFIKNDKLTHSEFLKLVKGE